MLKGFGHGLSLRRYSLGQEGPSIGIGLGGCGLKILALNTSLIMQSLLLAD